jgi:hypothetical protein
VTAPWDLEWRAGRKVPHHAYAIASNEASDDDVEVFVATGDFARATDVVAHIVAIHNAWLAGR